MHKTKLNVICTISLYNEHYEYNEYNEQWAMLGHTGVSIYMVTQNGQFSIAVRVITFLTQKQRLYRSSCIRKAAKFICQWEEFSKPALSIRGLVI